MEYPRIAEPGEPASTDVCVCGHERCYHVEATYWGVTGIWCQRCNPYADSVPPSGMKSDTYTSAMFFASQHDFTEAVSE